jgi:hypothetical protein
VGALGDSLEFIKKTEQSGIKNILHSQKKKNPSSSYYETGTIPSMGIQQLEKAG